MVDGFWGVYVQVRGKLLVSGRGWPNPPLNRTHPKASAIAGEWMSNLGSGKGVGATNT